VRDLATQAVGVHVVDERPLAVDLDDRQPLPIPSLEFRIPADVDFLELEPELLAHASNRRERALAQVAALGVVDDDFRGYG
jgi:hypothetical protein